jgi:dolichol-phosphate mannosyltransferase
MSRATVEVLTALPPHSRVYRLVVPALGFPSGEVGYTRETRAAGTSKYPLRRMVSLAVDSITGFSIAPLRIAAALGFVGMVVAFGGLVFSLVAYASGHVVPGWASLFTTVLFFSGVQLLCLGLLGEYVGRIHRVLRQMPPYVVAEDTGGRPPPDAGSSVADVEVPGATAGPHAADAGPSAVDAESPAADTGSPAAAPPRVDGPFAAAVRGH